MIFAAETVRLVGLTHTNFPSEERDALAIGYLIRGIGSPSLQWHLLTVAISTMVSTVLVIKVQMAVGSPEPPSSTEEETTSLQMDKVVQALAVQS